MWTAEHSTPIAAPAERVLHLFTDVAGWPRWNIGVAGMRLHGPFADGTRFAMQLPDGGPVLHSTLTDVRPLQGFVDVTEFAGVRVQVAHAITAREDGGARVVYRTQVDGPGAEDIGPGIAADFPTVLAALRREAEAAPPA